MGVFSQTAQWASNLAGRAQAFVAAFLLILAWASPVFGWSDT